MDTNMDSIEKYTGKLKKEYEKHLMKHDPDSPEAVHWVGREKLWLRFDILTEIGNLTNKKVLDFGCGNGLLLDYLNEKKIKCQYSGWDISEEMIAIARKRHSKADFKVCDILKDDVSKYAGLFDYIIINGVFNIIIGGDIKTHEAWVHEILLKLWSLCKEGITTDFLTEYVDWKEKELFYCSINDIISFSVKNLSRWFQLRHDYQLWEFTLYIYKQPKVKI